MALLTRRRWLEEGLALLEEAGAEALTIEALTNRLGVTKGSFYHHFANYQDLKERLLEFWEEEGTLRIIQWAEKQASPPEKLARVMQASLHPPRLDVALRAWALQDEQVRVHQQRIDQLRLAYLEELAYAQTADRLSARQLARAFYSLYVGSQHIIPPIQGEDLRACLKRGDGRRVAGVHLEYEKEPIVSNRFNRPSVGLYQRIDSCCQARRPTAHAGNASGYQCDLVSCRKWMPMAHAAA